MDMSCIKIEQIVGKEGGIHEIWQTEKDNVASSFFISHEISYPK